MKRVSEIFMATAFMVTLLGLMIATILLPKERYSYYENRNLSGIPEVSTETILSGGFFDEVETMLCDYAAGRTAMLKANTWLDLNLFRRPVVNDVVVTDDVLLPYRDWEAIDPSLIRCQADFVAEDNKALMDLIESYGGTYCYVAVPCQYAYYEDEYPSYLYNRAEYTQHELYYLTLAMEREGVPFVDMGIIFDELGHKPQYSSTVDNHFGLYGAYETYRAAINQINEISGLDLAFPEEGRDITFSELSNPYMGSRTRKLMGLAGNEEHLLTAQFKEDIPFTRYNNGTEATPTVYAIPPEGEQVLYSLYMGGDVAETVIDTNRPELPSVLIYGDSFTNAVEVLAYYSFDEMHSIDLRHYTAMSLAEYIALYQPDVVLCIRDYESLLSRQANGELF